MIQILVVPDGIQHTAWVLAGREVLYKATRWSEKGARRDAERFLNNMIGRNHANA